ncbi:MAG: hypothetical protein AAFP86_01510 [Planctomycetota bacterium]
MLRNLRLNAPLALPAACAALLAASCGGDAAPAYDPAPTAASTSTLPAVTAAEVVVNTPAPAPKSPRPSIDLTAEVPNDAIGYFECESIEALETLILRVQALTGSPLESAAHGTAVATIPLVNVGVDPTKIDPSAPVAVAFAPVPGELFPSPLVVAPARDEGPIVSSAAALTARSMKARRLEGGYVIVEHATAPSRDSMRGEAQVTKGLGGGLLRGRFASAHFASLLTPWLNDAARQLNESYRLSRPRQHEKDIYEFDADTLLERMREAREISFGLELDGDRAIVQGRTIDSEPFRAPAPDASGNDALELLCHHVDPEDPLSLLVTFDPEGASETLFHWLQELGDLAAEHRVLGRSSRKGPRILVGEIGDSLEQMLGSFDPAAALAFQLEPGKAHAGVYLASADAERAREAVSLLLSKAELDAWGFEMALPIRSMVDGTLVEDYTVRFDTRRLDFDQRAQLREGFKTFLGDSTLHLKVATAGNQVLIVLGGDTAAVNARIRHFAAEGPREPELERAIAAVENAGEAVILRTDFVKLLGQLAALRQVSRGQSVADAFREISREVGDGHAPFVLWSGYVDDDRLLGASFEIDSLLYAFEAFKGAGL